MLIIAHRRGDMDLGQVPSLSWRSCSPSSARRRRMRCFFSGCDCDCDREDRADFDEWEGEANEAANMS